MRLRLFLRLLDVRILVGVIRNTLTLCDMSFPEDVGEVRFSPPVDGRLEVVLERIGGPTADSILHYAQRTEREIIRLLDVLIAADTDKVPEGHNELYSLALLNGAELSVAGTPIQAQPLLMFDDGHRLHESQREALLGQLRCRRPAVARWYSERYEALSNQELLAGVGQEGRDVALVDLGELATRTRSYGKRFTREAHKRILRDIATRRVAKQLSTYLQEQYEFFDLLNNDREPIFRRVADTVLTTLKSRVVKLSEGDQRYDAWLSTADKERGFVAAVRWREIEILIERDQNRQQGLFEEVLSPEEITRRSNAAIREGAALLVAKEFRLPYYAGESIVLELGSHNVYQFLNVCGELFAEMLVGVSLDRPPILSMERQHSILKQVSDKYWKAIPRTIPYGRNVQALIRGITAIARMENAKARMPYPPGVTGTAILMAERDLLLDPVYRDRTPGAERLFSTLASAVAHNILDARLNYSVKNNRYMVLYLNRLLCPRFGLPLGYGSFRERGLRRLIHWVEYESSIEQVEDKHSEIMGQGLLM